MSFDKNLEQMQEKGYLYVIYSPVKCTMKILKNGTPKLELKYILSSSVVNAYLV